MERSLNKEKLNRLSKLSMYNKDALLRGSLCGCYYCGRVYNPNKIKDWTDEGKITAICPCCGIDAVLAEENDGTDLDVLEAMHQRSFLQGFDSKGNAIKIGDRRRKKFND